MTSRRRAGGRMWHRQRDLRYLVACLLCLVCGLLTTHTAHAAGDPRLNWWTIETKHFRIHYEKRLEKIAKRTARLSEHIHDTLVGPLGYVADERTEVVLTDRTDNANGSATAFPFNTVRLFITAPGDVSALGDYDDWLYMLMVHEFTHIAHIDNISGTPTIVNKILGKTLTPNQLQPRWFIEGLATVQESRFSTAGRIRSSLFDMQLRADVLDDRIMGLDEMSSGTQRWPFGTVYYLYGSRFLGWIADVYGMDVLRAVIIDYGATAIPLGINRAIRRQTGKTYEELFEGFKDHIRRDYDRQMRQVKRRGLRIGKRLTFHGRTAYYPQFVPKSAQKPGGSAHQIVYRRNDARKRAGIYRMDLGKGKDHKAELLVRASGNAPVSFGPDGSMYHSSVVNFRRFYDRTDIFRLGPNGRAPTGRSSSRERLTTGWRATAPNISSNGRDITFTINHQGTTRLMLGRLDDDGKIGRRKTIVRTKNFGQVYTPQFSPDGNQIAYSRWKAGGLRDIHIYDVRAKTDRAIHIDRAIEMQPTWSPDGKKLYFSSDRTGIYNIYEYTLESKRWRQVTNVKTGALMPTVSPDGKWLVYSGYTSYGYDLYALPLDESRFLEALDSTDRRPPKQYKFPAVPMKKARYNPLPTLRPRNYFVGFAPGVFGNNALTVTTQGGDVAGYHGFTAALNADPSAPIPQVTLDYVYRRLPVDLSVRLTNRVTPRTSFEIGGQRPEYLENSYGVRTGVSYAHLGEFFNQSFSLGYSANIIGADFPVAQAIPLDPSAPPTNDPFRGLLTYASLSYGIGNVENSVEAPGNARGFGLSLNLDVGNNATGSELSIYNGRVTMVGYIPMPWGDHVLATRTAGGMAAGSFTSRSLYYVGGFNLENVSLLDTVLDGPFDGSFALRGYPVSSFSGRSYLLQNLEYRMPVAVLNRGLSTLPLFLRRIDANFFLDYGGAFNRFDFDSVGFFRNSNIIDAPQLHTSVGAELWMTLVLGYELGVNMRLGHAYGFSPEAIPGGQTYFIASSAF